MSASETRKRSRSGCTGSARAPGISRRPGRVAGGLDGTHEAGELDLSRVVDDGRELGRVVHIRLDPVELVQLLLDASGAGCARHAADLKLEPAWSVDRHQAAS